MKKLDLIEKLKAEADLTWNEAATAVAFVFNEMSCALAKQDRVEIRGLCSFHIKKYQEYAGRNHRIGERVR